MPKTSVADDLQAAFQRLRNIDQPDEVPDGWHTAAELSEAWGYTHNHINALLQKGVRAGLWERKKFRIMNGERGLYRILHYREKPT